LASDLWGISHDHGTGDDTDNDQFMTAGRAERPAQAKTATLLIEWPTVLLIAATYGGFGLLTWHHAALPWWLLLPLGGYLVCLHGSLQHEAVHRHPTPWPALNEALVFPSLSLWVPYRIYRDSHLAHHRNEALTDPLGDPESCYLAPDAWARRGRWLRRLDWAQNTLLGRLSLGPLVSARRLYGAALGKLLRRDFGDLRAWLLHGLAVGLVLAWVLWICRLPLAGYLAWFAYPGIALTLLRSFLEHRACEPVAERSVLIEAGPVMSLLYLNNNLHALHHAEPGLAWYRLPARYRACRAALLAGNGGYRYGGYPELFRRYLLRPKEPPRHPCYHAPAFARLRVANDPGRPIDERVA
jgi:fatty acid desaturase